MKNILVLLFLFIGMTLCCQSNYQKFKKLSSPLKRWVAFHPFKAKRALQISKEAQKVSDSISKTNLLDGDPSGGQVDAFRHAYWMARLNQEIGRRAALSLGRAYEKGNYLTYKKKQLEDGVIPDKVSTDMDLFNNCVGTSLTTKGFKTTKIGLICKVVNAIRAGKMKIIKKHNKSSFLTCDGRKINPKELKGKWENSKCLVNSDKLNN